MGELGRPDGSMDVCLKRSKEAPLRIRHDNYPGTSGSDADSPFNREIDVDSVPEDSESADDSPEEYSRYTDPSEKTEKILFKHSHRFGQLHIDWGQTDTITRLNKPTPHLSLLTIFGACKFPADFIGGIAPSGLHTVKLRRCSLSLGDWSHNIRHLQLTRCRLEGDVFAALSAMTQLQDLRLSFHKDPVALVAENNSYFLPNLHTASFSFRTNQHIVNAFPHISAPKLQRLTITWPPRFEDTVLASRATRIFTSFFPDTIKWVSSNGSDHHLEFQGDESPIIFHNFQPKSLSDFLKMSSIEDSRVKTLHLYHLPALRELISSGNSAVSEAPAYPALQVLKLQSMVLNDGEVPTVKKKRKNLKAPDNTAAGPPTFAQLEGWLASRCKVSKLERLDMINCQGLPSDWLESLRKLLPVNSTGCRV